MKSKSRPGSKQFPKNPFGYFRKPPRIEEFRDCFEQCDGIAVQRTFFRDTASWVLDNLAPIELEIHQAATLGRAAREQNKKPDHDTVKAKFPRLAILATDGDMRKILESNPKPKQVAAEILSRVLQREESSITRWAQSKRK